jgi:hypothetical protein
LFHQLLPSRCTNSLLFIASPKDFGSKLDARLIGSTHAAKFFWCQLAYVYLVSTPQHSIRSASIGVAGEPETESAIVNVANMVAGLAHAVIVRLFIALPDETHVGVTHVPLATRNGLHVCAPPKIFPLFGTLPLTAAYQYCSVVAFIQTTVTLSICWLPKQNPPELNACAPNHQQLAASQFKVIDAGSPYKPMKPPEAYSVFGIAGAHILRQSAQPQHVGQ